MVKLLVIQSWTLSLLCFTTSCSYFQFFFSILTIDSHWHPCVGIIFEVNMTLLIDCNVKLNDLKHTLNWFHCLVTGGTFSFLCLRMAPDDTTHFLRFYCHLSVSETCYRSPMNMTNDNHSWYIIKRLSLATATSGRERPAVSLFATFICHLKPEFRLPLSSGIWRRANW